MLIVNSFIAGMLGYKTIEKRIENEPGLFTWILLFLLNIAAVILNFVVIDGKI